MPDPFADNSIQFPRLLAEINAVGLTKQQMRDLCSSMDLDERHVRALFERAEIEFERIKGTVGGYETHCASCDALLHSGKTCFCGCKVTKLFHRGKNGLAEIR
jgi:hypothetical protein